MANGSQFLLLTLKNFKIKGRNGCGTAVEVIFPIICLAFLIAMFVIAVPYAANYEAIPIGFQPRNLTYGPKIETVRKIMLQVVYGQEDLLYPVDSEVQMSDLILSSDTDFVGGVFFRLSEDEMANDYLADNVTYSIRTDANLFGMPNPTTLFQYVTNTESSRALSYYDFVAVQKSVDQAIMATKIQEKTGTISTLNLDAFVARFPQQNPETVLDKRWQLRNTILKPIGGTWLTFCLLFTVFRLVGTIIVEKKTRVRAMMQMMGVHNEWYWLTWFLVSLVLIIPVLVGCSVLLKYLNFFPLASIGYIFVTWILYAASLIAIAMIFGAILNSTKSSGIIALMIVVFFSVIGAAIAGADIPAAPKIVLALFSPVAFNNAIYVMAEAENRQMVIDDCAAEYIGGNPSLNSMIGMLVVDTVLYLLLAWYIDNVNGGGSKNKFCFCFRRSYWGKNQSNANDINEEELADQGQEQQNAENFENVNQLKRPVISIQNLRKKFLLDDGQSFIAVEGFSSEMYESEIIALLGHNGAGKTTLISMLTGLLEPTAGDAKFYGNSLTQDLGAVKKILGICPQYDAIWPQLTVFEHLQLYGGFKGVTLDKVKIEAEQLIKDFELEEKRDYPAGKLSGGQKRKLSIAIAIIGGSKVVFLDEPSAGMDPEARRVVWDNLVKYKEGRVIILTTHFMDEADYLGDRIAIMKQGKLLCGGSSLFLKNRFGLGYTLSCAKTSHCNIERLTEFLKEYEDVMILSNIGAEAIFRIPRAGYNNLSHMLNGIEEHKNELGVISYGISQSTLEEVFLELNMDSDLQGIADEVLKDTVFISGSESSNRRQLNALLNKRRQVAKLDVKFLTIQFVVPILLCIAALVIQRFMFSTSVGTQITFDGRTYDGFISPWSNDNCTTNFFAALPHYSPDLFPFIPLGDINSTLSNPDTYAAGALVNNICQSAGPMQLVSYGLYVNASLPHSLAYYQNLVSNAILNTALGGAGIVNITTVNYPAGVPIDLLTNLISILVLLLMLIGTCVLSASITAFIFQERELGIKQLQLASGTNAKIYWLSNFIWDLVLHLIIFAVIIVVAVATDYNIFGGSRIGATIVLFILYILASISASYFFTFVFSGSSSGQGAILGLFLGVSFGSLTVINAISAAVPSAELAMAIVGYICRALSPHYLLAASFGQITNSLTTKKSFVTENTNIFHLEFWGSSMIIFFGQFLIYGALTILLENMYQLRLKQKRIDYRQRDHSNNEEDDDVAKERELVNNAHLADVDRNLLWVKGLRKEFKSKSKISKTAVHNFSLRIPRGECFGLLGANGAGKTTTLKMLSGQLLPTYGQVSINGNSYSNLNQILQSIGFCPQYDSLIPKLSGRAHLELFAELRGLPKHKIPSVVDALIETIHLTKYADRPCGKYSGGNRRKLSLALALIGNPPVLYLDEPSTGMDPLARRFMWNLILAVRSNKAIILTTHSMEECEALCTRLGIMIAGKLRCLGCPQHLKTKFGEGYRLELKTDPDHVEHIPKFIQKLSPDARIVDQHTTLFNYEIPMNNSTLGQLLEQVESVKDELRISDYAVSQTTLEQIFINMAQEYLRHKVVIE